MPGFCAKMLPLEPVRISQRSLKPPVISAKHPLSVTILLPSHRPVAFPPIATSKKARFVTLGVTLALCLGAMPHHATSHQICMSRASFTSEWIWRCFCFVRCFHSSEANMWSKHIARLLALPTAKLNGDMWRKHHYFASPTESAECR